LGVIPRKRSARKISARFAHAAESALCFAFDILTAFKPTSASETVVMDRETFEQLVSKWLDEPERDDLRTRIDAALAQTPALASVKDQWQRLDQLVHSAFPDAGRVEWSRFRRRVDAGLETSGTEATLDERLRRLTAVEHRVDWPRLHQRVSQAVADAAGTTRLTRFPIRRVGVALAAAAALALMFTLPTQPPIEPTGFARVLVSSPADALPVHGSDRPYACVTVMPLPDTEEPPDGTEIPRSGWEQAQLAEVFLMVEPAHVACAPGGQMDPFGLN
jgi:hypothetical protein